jgi:lysophospholipase L1-like esterase
MITRCGTPDDSTHQRAVTLLRYADLSRHPMVRQLGVPAAALDTLIGAALHLTPAALANYRLSLTATRSATVTRLLTDPDVTHALGRLPFVPGDRVGIIGYSISADALSWAHLLGDMLVATDSGVEVINESVTGRTTADAIAALPVLLEERPTTVLILLGVNDVRRYGPTPGVRMASARETRRNLAALQAMVRAAGSSPILIAPPPAAPPAVSESLWTATDLDELAALVRAADPHAVDLRRASSSPSPALVLPDGVHPSAAGQIQILRDIVAALGHRDGAL